MSLPIREHLLFLYKYVHFLTKILQNRRKCNKCKEMSTRYVAYENK